MISALMDMLSTCYECGDFALMEVVARTVQQVIPDDVVSLHFLGLAYLKTGRSRMALSLFGKSRQKPLAEAATLDQADSRPALPDTHTAAAGCYLEATCLNPGLNRAWQAAASEIESFARGHRDSLEAKSAGG